MFNNFSLNRATYYIMWRNTVETDRQQMKIHNTAHALCIPDG
jgi:transposase